MLKIYKNVAFMPYQNYQYTNYQDFCFLNTFQNLSLNVENFFSGQI